jgi:hypothetical protein
MSSEKCFNKQNTINNIYNKRRCAPTLKVPFDSIEVANVYVYDIYINIRLNLIVDLVADKFRLIFFEI